MSNDTRLWAARLVFWLGMGVNGWAFTNMLGAILSGFGPNAKPAHLTVWTIVTVVTTVGLVPAGVLMHRYKKQRWDPSRDPSAQARSEVEILAAYAALEKQQPQPSTSTTPVPAVTSTPPTGQSLLVPPAAGPSAGQPAVSAPQPNDDKNVL